jgi:curli biogenesis system outer membrane secretion channel CsgG
MVAFAVGLILAVAALGQQATAAKKIYKNIEIEKFTIRQGVEYPAADIDPLANALVNNFRDSKRFDNVSLAGQATPAESTAADSLRISGEVIKYVKGSRAARYLVGLGAGKTKIIVDVKFVNAATGETVLQQTVDGDVTWGIFGGDSDKAKSGVADEIIRLMKKEGLAGEKKK